MLGGDEQDHGVLGGLAMRARAASDWVGASRPCTADPTAAVDAVMAWVSNVTETDDGTAARRAMHALRTGASRWSLIVRAPGRGRSASTCMCRFFAPASVPSVRVYYMEVWS